MLNNGPSEELEAAIARDAGHSYLYAKRVLNQPFPLGEAAIAKDGYFSYFYARDVIRGRFAAGEAAISTARWYSYLYARYVLKGRFLAGEAAISKDIKFCLDYQFRFNRDICPKEDLSAFPAYALSYAIMKNSRFPFGEPALKKSHRIWRRYKSFLEEIGVLL